MTPRRPPRARRGVALAALAACAALLSPVAAAPASAPLSLPQIVEALRERPGRPPEAEALLRATEALRAASDMDLQRASKAMNEALRLDARNASLHFFNGFVYHLQSRQGDAAKVELAIEGYQQAVRLEPANWVAQEFLGLALLDQRQYGRAQAAFAEALLHKADDPVLLVRMLGASYLAGDPRTACAMADRLAGAGTRAPDGFARSAVAVYAACGEFDKAEAARSLAARDAADDARLGARIAQWQQIHRARPAAAGEAALRKTQFVMPGGTPAPATGGGFGAPAAGGGFGAPAGGGYGAPAAGGYGAGPGGYGMPAQAPATAPSSGTTRMVLVDVVMLRTEDSIATNRGINLLGALNLQLGSSSAPAYSRSTSSTSGEGATTVLTRAISVPALAYSLNLANANSNLNEVLARPTLAAVEGMRSEFFSGTSLNAAVVSAGGVSGGSSVSIEKRYGVRLSVLPQILPDGMIRLSVDASRTFLKPPSENIGFTYKLEISEILANANVVLRLGDTLVLGGLSEKESNTFRDGVPVLQDVPLLQYLFSQQQRSDYQRSVLILITPRPAAYTWLSEETRVALAKDSDDATASVEVLRARYGDWFKPYPNLASVFQHLNSADLYREFRTGDVTLERWDRMETTRERLRQALEFLYY